VRRARPGDLVLVAPGVYHESVRVPTARIVIRGEDRNRVVVDGAFRRANGFFVTADGVAIENLTVRHFTTNGVIFSGEGRSDDPPGTTTARGTLHGYRASYVTAYDNGLYGIYAFGAQDGVIEHVYASGHPDSGVYIGQCAPCNALVRDATAQHNAIGFELTNAGGRLSVVSSTFSRNRVGITLTSQHDELLAPQRGDTLVAGNRVTDNSEPVSPKSEGAFGYGIAIGGGSGNTVAKNLVTGNSAYGVVITSLDGYAPTNNCVRENRLARNGVDIAYAPRVADSGGAGNSGTYGGTSGDGGSGSSSVAAGNGFDGNDFATAFPAGIQDAFHCGASVAPAPSGVLPASPAQPPGATWRSIPAPPDQPTMPNVRGRARPAVKLDVRVDVSTIAIPGA